jgi:hypothetical protein
VPDRVVGSANFNVYAAWVPQDDHDDLGRQAMNPPPPCFCVFFCSTTIDSLSSPPLAANCCRASSARSSRQMIAQLIEHDVDQQALQLRRIGGAILLFQVVDALLEMQRVEAES